MNTEARSLAQTSMFPHPRFVTLAAVLVVVAALFFAREVLVPVAIAGLASFVLSPLVARLERWHWRRAPAVVAVTLLTFGVIVLVGSVVIGQATDLVENLPQYRAHLVEKVAVLRARFGVPLQRASAEVQRIGHELGASSDGSAGHGDTETSSANSNSDSNPHGAPTSSTSTTPPSSPSTSPTTRPDERVSPTDAVKSVVSFLTTAAIVSLLVILMLLQRDDLRDRLVALGGGSHVVLATQTLRDATRRVSRYLLVLTLLNCVYGTIVGLALWWIGIPNSLLWGLLWAVLRFVPYVGPWVAAAIPVAFALLRFESYTPALLAVGLYVVLEVANLQIVEPLVFPTQVGVSRVALVVSVLFWTWLWGVAGLVLATPLTVCLAAIGKHVPRLKFLDLLLGDEPALPPSSRLYQRVLAADGDAAWDLVHSEFQQGRDLVAVYDAVVLPALVQAQSDRRDGTVDDATLARVARHLRELVDEANDRSVANGGDAEDTSARRAATDEPSAANEPPTIDETKVDGNQAKPAARPFSVLCMHASHELDAIACTMTVQALRHAGVDAREVDSDATIDDVLKRLTVDPADVVCLSQLPPVQFTRLRHLCKRLTTKFPKLPIVVATWTVTLDPVKVRERMQSESMPKFATTIAEVVREVRSLADVEGNRAGDRTAPSPDSDENSKSPTRRPAADEGRPVADESRAALPESPRHASGSAPSNRGRRTS